MSSQHLSHTHLRFAALLLLLVTLSALSVVYTTFQNRQLFIELQSLQAEATRQQTQLGQLLLEESTWSSLAMIEQVASAKLAMQVPNPDQLIIAQQLGDISGEFYIQDNSQATASEHGQIERGTR